MSRYTDIDALLTSLGEGATVEQVEYALRDHITREVLAVLADRAAAGGGGLGVLEDPGQGWQELTAYTQGDLIAETVEAELRVFEATASGTSADLGGGTFADLGATNLSPLGITLDEPPLSWRYLGIVGDVSWADLPSINSVPDTWEFNEFGGVTVTSPAAADDYETLLDMWASGDEVLVLTTAGDADWWFFDSGTSLRFHDDSGPVNKTIMTIGQDLVQVVAKDGSLLLEVDRAAGSVRLPNLPTIEPAQPEQLWVDGDGFLKVTDPL